MCKAVKVIVRNYLGEKLLLFFDRPYHELHNLHCTSSHQSREQEIGMVLRCCLIPGLWGWDFYKFTDPGPVHGISPICLSNSLVSGYLQIIYLF